MLFSCFFQNWSCWYQNLLRELPKAGFHQNLFFVNKNRICYLDRLKTHNIPHLHLQHLNKKNCKLLFDLKFVGEQSKVYFRQNLFFEQINNFPFLLNVGGKQFRFHYLTIQKNQSEE